MLGDTKARKIKSTDKPIADGTVPGLFLHPTQKTGAGKWVFRFKSPETGKRRDMGLGSYPGVSVKEARELAWQARKLLEADKDPLAERDRKVRAERVMNSPAFAGHKAF